jgi:hypothetical protein
VHHAPSHSEKNCTTPAEAPRRSSEYYYKANVGRVVHFAIKKKMQLYKEHHRQNEVTPSGENLKNNLKTAANLISTMKTWHTKQDAGFDETLYTANVGWARAECIGTSLRT